MTKLVKTLEIVVPTWMIVKGGPDTPGPDCHKRKRYGQEGGGNVRILRQIRQEKLKQLQKCNTIRV